MEDIEIIEVKANEEYICQLCENGKLYLNLYLMNVHIIAKHPLEDKLKPGEEITKRFARQL